MGCWGVVRNSGYVITGGVLRGGGGEEEEEGTGYVGRGCNELGESCGHISS